MRRALLVAAGLLAAALGAFEIGFGLFVHFLRAPATVEAAAVGKEARIVIGPGMDAEALARLLGDQGLIARPDWFASYLREQRGRPFEPGEYALHAGMTPAEIGERLRKAQVVTYPLTIEPGATARQIAADLGAQGLGDAARLTALVADGDFAHRLGIAADRLEGYFYPDTYQLPRGLSPEDLLGRLVARMRSAVGPELLREAAASGLDLHGVIVLASLVEREQVGESERPQVAAMLRNRLARHLPLRSAASAAYGLGKPADELTADDRQNETPYNTFLREGLPPTPICAPSLSSLVAAAHAVKTDALFYAPRANDSGHIFCPDEECQRMALEKYRAARERAERQSSPRAEPLARQKVPAP